MWNKVYTELSTRLKIDARRNLLTMSHAHYLDLIGIERWQLRTSSISIKPAAVLTPLHSHLDAQWLFILEKEEAAIDTPLLGAIVAAIGQSLETVAFAYYDTQPSTSAPLVLPALRCIVVMGEEPATLLQMSGFFGADISIIVSDNLQMLAHNIQSKRQLWQQLKQHRS